MYDEKEIFSKLDDYEKELEAEEARDREMFPFLFDEKGCDWMWYVPSGWKDKAREFFGEVKDYLDKSREVYKLNFRFEILELKEKYGWLRMYYDFQLNEEPSETSDLIISNTRTFIDEKLVWYNKNYFSKMCFCCGRLIEERMPGSYNLICTKCMEAND